MIVMAGLDWCVTPVNKSYLFQLCINWDTNNYVSVKSDFHLPISSHHFGKTRIIDTHGGCRSSLLI